VSFEQGCEVGQQRTLKLPGEPTSVVNARQFALDISSQLGASDELLPQIALVVSELATNAVQASPNRPYELTVAGDDQRLRIQVVNWVTDAEIPGRSSWRPMDPLAPKGRGLGIVDHLVDELEVERQDSHVRLTATIRLER
jgi:anti-sigma regulatory factor (Ser/Thr protein kinase)